MTIRKKYYCLGLILLNTAIFIMVIGCTSGKYLPEKNSIAHTNKRKSLESKIKSDLPNVLIIGDSISIGYTPFVKTMLEGKANVIHAPGNNQGTSLGYQKLSEWLAGEMKWHVIHFNWGLHDLKHVKVAGTSKNSNDPNDPHQADIFTYEKNMNILAKQLKSTGAKLIFATTTPYPAGVKPCRIPEDAVKYNKVAQKIMNKNGIKVNDLYSLVLPRLKELQKPVNVHFKPEGSKVLAEQVAQSILCELEIEK